MSVQYRWMVRHVYWVSSPLLESVRATFGAELVD